MDAKTIRTQLAEAVALHESLSAELTAAKELAEKQAGELASLREASALLVTERDRLTASLAAATAERTTLQTKVTQLETDATTASAKAADILAGMGHPPVPADPAASTKPTDLWAQYAEIERTKGAVEATRFYRANRDAMRIKRG